MKKIIASIFLILLVFCAYDQHLQNANWCFGWNAGMNFNPNPPAATTSAIHWSNPGFSTSGTSVSDDNGQLLFYTDGITVWNRNHNIMLNGQGLWGYSDYPILNNSAIIVPKPGNPGIYYIFTIGATERYLGSWTPLGRGGLHYSVVDMNLDNNNGGVVPWLKKIPLSDHNGVAVDYDFTPRSGSANQLTIGAKMTSALHFDEDKIWVCIFAIFNNSCESPIVRYAYSYLVTATGINHTVPDGISPVPFSSVPLSNSNYMYSHCLIASVMKISPNGQLLADAEYTLNLYNFNNQTGSVSFGATIYTPPPTNDRGAGSGVEFSPNSQLIYFTEDPFNLIQGKPIIPTTGSSDFSGALYQYDLSTKKTSREGLPVNFPDGIASAVFPVASPKGLQLARDNRIYLCAFGAQQELLGWLGVIQNPNIVGTGCNFLPQGVALLPGTQHMGSLPQWVHKAKSPWPKIYEAVEANGIKTDNNGNLLSFIYIQNMANNINHIGPITSGPAETVIHYNTASGYTNWVNTIHWKIGLPLSGGITNFVNTGPWTNIYRNTSTGTIVTGPNVPSQMELIAEDNGGYIVRDGYNLRTYNSSGILVSTIPIASISGYYLDAVTRIAIYHPVNHRLFVCWTYFSGSLGYFYQIGVYDFNQFTHTLTLVNTPANNQIHGPVVQVNSNEKIFVYNPNNQQLEEYDLANNSYTTLFISNFSNNSLEEVDRSNHLVEDRIIIKNTNLHYFYCINTSTTSYTSTKVPYSPPTPASSSEFDCYAFEGNSVFLSGQYVGTGFTIGTQSLPLLGSGSVYVTKISLSEFNKPSLEKVETPNFIDSKRTEAVTSNKINIFPNPSKEEITINGLKGRQTSIIIFDMFGHMVLNRQVSTSDNMRIPLVGVSAGVYNCTIKNEEEVITKKIVVVK